MTIKTRTIKEILPLAALLLLLGFAREAPPAQVAPSQNPPPDTPERAARMRWFRDAKFGLFIHWGLYAIPAGEWNGKPVAGIGS